MSIPDQVNHELNLAEVTGTQKRSDEKWNNAAVTYSGLLPNLSRAQGRQRGYFINDHGADGRDWGTFDGKVTTSDAEISIEGSWQFTGGDGKFKDLTGKGTFKNKITSPRAAETSWQGTYGLAIVAKTAKAR